MVWVGDEASTNTKEGEGFDLQVGGGGGGDVCLVHGDVAVVLLVHVQILDEALLHEVLPMKVAELFCGNVGGATKRTDSGNQKASGKESDRKRRNEKEKTDKMNLGKGEGFKKGRNEGQ